MTIKVNLTSNLNFIILYSDMIKYIIHVTHIMMFLTFIAIVIFVFYSLFEILRFIIG